MTPRPADDTPSPADDAGLAARLAAAEAAVQAAPGLPERWRALAEVQDAVRDYPAALASVGRALELAPLDPANLRVQAQVLGALGRRDAELAVWDRLVAMAPDDPELRTRRGAILSLLERHPEALADLDQAIAVVPGDPDARFWRAATYRNLERYADEVADLEVVLQTPTEMDFWYRLLRAQALRDLERFDDALVALAGLVADQPDYAAGYDLQGDILQQTGRYPEAVTAYTHSLAQWEGDEATLLKRAVALAHLGDAPAAERDVAAARAGAAMEGGLSAGSLYDVVCVYALLGKLPAAIDAAAEAIDAGYDDLDWLEDDPDLAALQAEPAFGALLDRLAAALAAADA